MSKQAGWTVALIAAALVLVAAIVWASMTASLAQSFAATIADPWGAVMLIDLYAGLLAAAALILIVEPDRRIAWASALALPFLGNVVTLIWLALRGLPRLLRRG